MAVAEPKIDYVFNREGVKYSFAADFNHKLSYEHAAFVMRYVSCRGKVMIFKRGYGWDGPSGPAYDNPETIIPSAVHDAFYGHFLEYGCTRRERCLADKEYRSMLVAYGYPRWRAWVHYAALRVAGWHAAGCAPWK